MLDTLKTLCYLKGVSGFEDEVRDYILERVMHHADEVKSDPLGNLMVFKKGKVQTQQRIMLCAHMDEVGLIVTSITDEGYLKFDCVGGIDRRVLIGKKVYVGESGVLGIIGIKAVHLTKAEERKNVPEVDDMYIDIGCENKEDAEKLVNLGDYICFDDRIVEFGNGYLKAKAIDDRIGCAVMLKLIESELPCDTWFAFTVQEEVGARGAQVAANAIEPDVCLVLEGTSATDVPGTDDEKNICNTGEGVVIPFMDKGAIYSREIYAILSGIAEENGIKWQTKRRSAGSTDGKSVQRSGVGVKTGALSGAIRNIHSPVCVGKISEFDDLLLVAQKFLEYCSSNAV